MVSQLAPLFLQCTILVSGDTYDAVEDGEPVSTGALADDVVEQRLVGLEREGIGDDKLVRSHVVGLDAERLELLRERNVERVDIDLELLRGVDDNGNGSGGHFREKMVVVAGQTVARMASICTVLY